MPLSELAKVVRSRRRGITKAQSKRQGMEHKTLRKKRWQCDTHGIIPNEEVSSRVGIGFTVEHLHLGGGKRCGDRVGIIYPSNK